MLLDADCCSSSPEAEHAALLAFLANSTVASEPLAPTTSNACSSPTVQCNSCGRVVELSLTGASGSAELRPDLSNLECLQFFQGAI